MLSRTVFNMQFQTGYAPDGTPTYLHNKIARNEMYKEYVKEQEVKNMSKTASVAVTTGYFGSLGGQPCSLAPIEVCSPYAYGCNQEGNNPMNYASASISTPATETQDQRKYLAGRLEDVYRAKRNPLEAQFGLTNDEEPRSVDELKARIAAGKFSFRDEKDIRPYHHWTEMLIWRDPAKKADMDGFKAAKDDLKAKRQAALDTIKIDEPKAGLEAIKALEAWTPTGAAN